MVSAKSFTQSMDRQLSTLPAYVTDGRRARDLISVSSGTQEQNHNLSTRLSSTRDKALLSHARLLAEYKAI
jgi:hypothetical protein